MMDNDRLVETQGNIVGRILCLWCMEAVTQSLSFSLSLLLHPSGDVVHSGSCSGSVSPISIRVSESFVHSSAPPSIIDHREWDC